MLIQEILAKKLREANDAEKAAHTPSGYWNPSELGFCDRSSVLKHAGVEPNPFDDASLRNFWLGNLIHGSVQGQINSDSSSGIVLIGHELPYRDESLRVSGRLDTYLVNDGVRESVEFKSAAVTKFQYGELPEPRNIFQVACSLKFRAKCPDDKGDLPIQGEWLPLHCNPCGGTIPGPHNLLPLPERGRLVYISKNDGKIEEFIITLTDRLSSQVEEEFLRLERLYQRYLADKMLPEPLPLVTKKGKTAPDWRTRYCNFAGKGCCGDEQGG